MPAFENSVRIPALAVIRHHIDSRIESDQVNTVTAVDGVRACVLVSLDHIIAGASVHRVDARDCGGVFIQALPTKGSSPRASLLLHWVAVSRSRNLGPDRTSWPSGSPAADGSPLLRR